jgi:hypothetical protein
MPLSPSPKISPFDIPKPQKTSELLVLDLEIQLVSYQSRLEDRKRLLWAIVKVVDRFHDADPADRQETGEKRLERLVNKRECLIWIVKVCPSITTRVTNLTLMTYSIETP